MQIAQAALEAARSARRNDAFVPAFNAYHETVTNALQKEHRGLERQFVFADGLAESFSRFLLREADVETERRMVVAAIALERYRRRHGQYPEKLDGMTPDILQKVPVDFMDGKPLRYRRKDDGTFLLYSVGENGKDEGGDGSPMVDFRPDVQPWYKTRDAVWPSPATPDEVKKYEAEMLRRLIRKPPGKLVPQIIPEPPTTNSKTN